MAENMLGMLQEAQKMQGKLMKIKKKLERITVEASAGGDMVKVKINGKHELVAIEIAKEAVDPNEVEMLQDLIIAAHAEATRRLQELMQEEMQELTNGMSLPPGLQGMM